MFGDNLAGERAVDVGKRGTDRKFLAGAHQATPHAFAIDGAKQKALDLPASRSAGMQARRQDGGVVTKKNVARAEESREVGKRVVGHSVRRPIHDEETGLVAPRGGRLGDQMRRERIVEEIGGEWCHERGARHEADQRQRGENLSWVGPTRGAGLWRVRARGRWAISVVKKGWAVVAVGVRLMRELVQRFFCHHFSDTKKPAARPCFWQQHGVSKIAGAGCGSRNF